MPDTGPPFDVVAIREQLDGVLNAPDRQGRIVGDSKFGVYAFYDYDGEPIYIGQTRESLRTRIRRHMTNQRTDAVAMSVLDPFEVAEIEMWPLFDLSEPETTSADVQTRLDSVEYTLYGKLLNASMHKAVLNEKEPTGTLTTDIPPSTRGRIIPDEIFELRKHSDVRIARRASTIASLAKVISERKVQSGLRRTLLTQAKRLEALANSRLNEVE